MRIHPSIVFINQPHNAMTGENRFIYQVSYSLRKSEKAVFPRQSIFPHK
jgi:hypothetical protein